MHKEVMSFKLLVRLCENGGMRCKSEFLVFLGLKHAWYLWKMTCVCIRKRVLGLLKVMSTSYKQFAMLLDFQEKWENKFLYT